jgi:hypothetical protein
VTSRDYQLMVSALAEVAKRRDAELAGAERAYRDSSAAAAGELARAEGEAAEADRWAGAAAAAVLEVDREAARVWEQLRRVPGVRARALGELPEPAPGEALPRVAIPRGPDATEYVDARQESARTVLDRAAERVGERLRPVRRRPLPRWLLPALPLVGALVAAVTGLVAGGLVTMGTAEGSTATALRSLGWLAFLVAPSAGVPVAAWAAHRALNARLDVGGVGLTLLGGMLAAAALSFTFTH